MLSVLSSGKVFSVSSMLRSHCNVCDVIYLLRRRMPWLEDRWRTQRTVLNISNCRFPRKKRILNAFCELALCQLTWLAVTAICSRPNSEVWMVISCRRVSRRRDRRSQRVFVSNTNSCFVLCCVWMIQATIWVSKFFYARSRSVTGVPAEFKHINKWRSKN